jgi:hypothetical protein
MDCPNCGTEMLTFTVPEDMRDHADSDDVGFCPRCLTTAPSERGGDSDFSRVSDAFPGGRGGAAMALALGKLDSLALNRADIEGLLEAAEREGVDPMLLIDRLAAQGNVRPAFDIDRRRHQIEQLL